MSSPSVGAVCPRASAVVGADARRAPRGRRFGKSVRRMDAGANRPVVVAAADVAALAGRFTAFSLPGIFFTFTSSPCSSYT